MRNKNSLDKLGTLSLPNGETRNSKFEILRRFRLPFRRKADIEEAAARNRAERLFEVNFRSKWTR